MYGRFCIYANVLISGDSPISLLFLGHNFRTINTIRSTKGSKDSDFRLVLFTTKKRSIPCCFFQALMTSSENHVTPLFHSKIPPPPSSNDSLWLEFLLAGVFRRSPRQKPLRKNSQESLQGMF